MEKLISCCAGQAGFNFNFNNGKIIDYQNNDKKLVMFHSQYTMILRPLQVVLCFPMLKRTS